MATQKPISTISYNSESFLLEHLEEWYEAHIIQSWQYICHKGEDGDRDHIHLRIEPNKKLDPMNLAEELREFVQGSSKPLGVRPFRPSKEEDWILYAVHDKEYLHQKYRDGEKGEKLPYKWEEIRCPDDYDMEIAYIRAKSHLEHSQASTMQRLQKGATASSLITEGVNVFQVNAMVRALSLSDMERLTSELNDVQSAYIELQHYCTLLEDAIQQKGYTIHRDDESVTLT